MAGLVISNSPGCKNGIAKRIPPEHRVIRSCWEILSIRFSSASVNLQEFTLPSSLLVAVNLWDINKKKEKKDGKLDLVVLENLLAVRHGTARPPPPTCSCSCGPAAGWIVGFLLQRRKSLCNQSVTCTSEMLFFVDKHSQCNRREVCS